MSGQLEFSHHKRRRGRKPKPALEFRTCCALAETIRYMIRGGWRFSHLPFGERRSAVTGARLKRLGVARGWPDYAFLGPQGRTFWLEMKRGRLGRLTDAQEEFALHAVTHGHDYLCAKSYDEAIVALVARKIIRAPRGFSETMEDAHANPASDGQPERSA